MCTTESKAIQCDLCHVWVHSECEGISNESYNKMNEIFSGVANVSYYCELNSCHSRIKQLVSDWKLSHSAEPLLADDSLSEKYLSSSISPTLTILDELADRDRRSKNLILYNLSETSDPQTDKLKVQELFSTVFSLKEVQLNRITCLGKCTDVRARPLLVSFADALIRSTILSQSGRLRNYEQCKNVYISPDRTKLEREKHHKLVTELKRRRSNGEQNLVIRNNAIVTYTRRPQPTISVPNNQRS